MKQLLFLIPVFIIYNLALAQNVGIGTSSPNALLDVSATNNGILIPRVALTGTGSASPLTSPTTSTLVYNTATAGSGATSVSPGFYYWNGSAWVRVIDNSSLTGATSVSNTSSANTLSTTVNGVTGATVPMVNSIGNNSSTNSISTTVNGITGPMVPIVNSISNNSSANILSTTVNGVTGTGVNIINSNALGLTGNNLTATINGVGSSAQSLSGLSLSGDVTGTLAGSSVGKIQGQPVSATTPTAGQVLEYVGSTWTPTSPTLGTVTSIGTTAPITGGTITGSGTIGISQATTSTSGYLSSTDWNTFNNKQGTISLTTIGSSGAATFSSNTLNIPNYTLAGLGGQPTLTAGNGISILSNIISANLWTASGTNIYNANSGYVGIGTSSPISTLDVEGGDVNVTGQGRFKGWYTQGTGLAAEIGVSSGQAIIVSYNRTAASYQPIQMVGSTVSIGNSGGTDIFINSSGYVGIGTTSPGFALEVTSPSLSESRVYIHPSAANGTDYALLQFNNTGGTSYFGMDNSGGSGLGSGAAYALTTYAASGIPIAFVAGGSERMRILSGGNVGIGTTSPGSILDVQGGDVNVSGQGRFKGWYTQGSGLAAEIGISSGQAYIYSYNRTASSYQPMNLSGSTVAIGHSGGTDIFINTSGYVGIGTTTATYPLTVNGDIFDVNCSIGGGTAIGLTGDLPGYANGIYPVLKSTYAYLYISVGGNYSAYISAGGSYNAVSSRRKKENFQVLDKQDILSKINALEMYKWDYICEPHHAPHIAPLAEDFYAKFGLGDCDSMISHLDPAGIALVGVQALSQRIDELRSASKPGQITDIDDRVKRLESENEQLKAQIEALRKIVESKTEK